ncbi:MAG: hypothetical protein Q8P24_01950 [Desulfobacterales bacterium]|nr:hypothetical protein [Desulfobacterales bacterium]
MDEQEKEYSLTREIGIVLSLGILIGLIILGAGLAIVEFLKG